jgi:23S rRNA (pseudouridine1915-N3)-methyltransferase
MITLDIIALGKLKETYWRAAEAEYLKRLKPYFKIEIRELKEESFTEKDRPEIIRQKESKKIKAFLAKIKDALIIILDEHGKAFTSVQFAQQLKNITTGQTNNIVFIIGGPLGLDESILNLANLKLSLSSLTFTHQMARIFLLEQIYRAAMINAGRKYHY